MRQKLKIDRKLASMEDFHAARRSFIFWPQPKKLDVLEELFLFGDTGFSRTKFASMNGISRRTLQRWVGDFNAGGLTFALESALHRPGRKRKVGLLEFRERILPAAQLALRESGRPETIKNLFASAQNLGLVDVSYATFRRRLQQTSSSYKRRKVEPTYDEWMFHTQTGRWPARVKSFGRRRAKDEKLAWQRARESFQQRVR